MKIVHLVGWYFPDSVGGTEVYVEGLCRRLRAAGHDVLVAVPTTMMDRAGTCTHDDVPVFRYRIARDPTRDEAYHRVPVRGATALYEWLAGQRPDVLHVHSLTTGVGLPELREARRLGIRVVVTCHLPGLGFMCRTGELMEQGRQPCDGVVDSVRCTTCSLTRLGLPAPLAGATAAIPGSAAIVLQELPGRVGTMLGMRASVDEYAKHQRELFELVDAFVVLNETAKRMLIANGSPANKIVINRLGLSHPVAREARDRRTRRPVRFGYVGRLHEAKGLVPLARAVQSISADIEFTLEIRGPVLDSAAHELIQQLRAICHGDPRIVFAPAVDSSDVPSVLSTIDVLLCPSISFENGPTVALEAHAVGTPVVGSRVGNLLELIRDGVNGRLVTPGALEEWAAVIAEIACSPKRTIDEWRKHLGAPRTMDDIAVDYLALYAA